MRGKSKWSLVLVLVLALSMVLSACGSSKKSDNKSSSDKGSSSADSNYTQVINFATTEDIPTLDTAVANDQVSFQVAGQVYEGLYTIDDNNNLVPALAVGDPTITKDSAGNSVYTFKLQPNAKWSNGDPVTAKDFVYAWQDVVNPKTKNVTYSYLFPTLGVLNSEDIMAGKKPVTDLGVKAVDDHTLQVTLTHQVPFYKSLFAMATFYPKDQKFVEAQGKDYGLSADKAVYNGPYVLSSWQLGAGWTYKKNPNYWDAKDVQVSQINEKVVKDEQAQINLYNGGQIDAVVLTGDYVNKYKSSPEFHQTLGTSVYYLKFNEQNKYLKNPDIRKAISMAWDRQPFLSKLVNDGSIDATGLVPKGFYKTQDGQDFREENGSLQDYDLAQAKKYWKKGLKELGVSKINLEILAYDTDTYKNEISYIQDQLQTNLPGLTVSVNQQEFKVMLDKESSMKYDIVTAGWGPDYQDPMTFLDMFTTGNGNNQMGYSNKQYDALIKDAQNTTDLKKRDQDMLDAEKILIQQDGALGLMYQQGGATLVKPYLVNFKLHPFGFDYSYKYMSVKKH
ncbi:peptide ABC transporter substrate-binding protein [Pullulanibacillus sp. KACC 23026]|uniref:peptide ABC transporter substrate-binding protein n=1 Tax=Pullulanibacillus sp. KACC 23026 TaxID=3028315 RepID=UPI0023AFEFFC|nr:peptide ABC transporter substrate-binding protein [Pullulanibacillus sp. KACC 23026]WEG11926.1 peptide ABC transporter substrate-binding protein [Pullulanibacillus sp. KACC 23026]